MRPQHFFCTHAAAPRRQHDAHRGATPQTEGHTEAAEPRLTSTTTRMPSRSLSSRTSEMPARSSHCLSHCLSRFTNP